jgi:hypothetical protein
MTPGEQIAKEVKTMIDLSFMEENYIDEYQRKRDLTDKTESHLAELIDKLIKHE